MKYALHVIFLLSALFLPWWCTVPLGILLTTMPYGSLVAILGGLIMDVTFGAALQPLFGLAYLYTTVFVCAALLMALLENRVLD